MFSYPSVLTFVLGAQKNRLIETVLLSTHNICYSCEIRKLFFITHFYLDAWCVLTVNALASQKKNAITGYSCVKDQHVKSYGLAQMFY